MRTAEKKFAALRERCVAAHTALAEYKAAMQRKYGFHYDAWIHQMTTAEDRKHDSLQKKRDKADDKLFALLDKISPRNWRSGAPAHWVATKLPYEDAVRPLDERLSVTPPIAYGHREPMR